MKYTFFCYDQPTGTDLFPRSVEVDVEANHELEAFELCEKAVKRFMYKLQRVEVNNSPNTI